MLDFITLISKTTEKTLMLYRYWLVTIKCNQSTLLYLLAVFFISVITNPAAAILDHVLCPPYYVYTESGDNCLFILNACGNSSYARQRCREEAGSVISFIRNEFHFDEICQFSQKRFTDNSSFYLGAQRQGNQSKFVWELFNTPVSFGPKLMQRDKGHGCLEMTVSKSGCFITDTHCHKQTSPVCEFHHVNPCLYNNGGCEGICMPRHRGQRKCTCQPGMISIGPRCEKPGEPPTVTCPSGTIDFSDDNVCIGLIKDKRVPLNSRADCGDEFGTRTIAKARDRTLAITEKFIKALEALTTDTMFTVGAFYKWSRKYIKWNNDRNVDTSSADCLTNTDNNTGWGGSGCVYLNTIDRCYAGSDCNTHGPILCEIEAPNECKNDPTYGNCPALIPCVTKSGYRKFACERPCDPGYYYDNGCVDLNECKWHNGGCHHHCRNTIGSRECSCMEGYYLVNDTECRYKDKCMLDPLGDGCPKINIYKSNCKPRYHNDDTDDDDTEQRWISTALIFILFIVICFCVMALATCCDKIIAACKKPQHQNHAVQSTQLKNEQPGTPSISQDAEIVSTSIY